MKYNLKEVRKKYGFSMQEMGKFIGIMPTYYSKYEEEGEIPSKYIYRLWLKISDFPVPDDFFCYTSFIRMLLCKVTLTGKIHLKSQNLWPQQYLLFFCNLLKASLISWFLRLYIKGFNMGIITV